MSTPDSPPLSGVSGSSGIYMGDIAVEVRVTPQDNGDVRCDMDCNGKKVRVSYRAAGDIDFDNWPFET
jgi:hypothetical protein